MNVLHVYRTYFPETQGGAQEVIRQICANTTRLGVTNRVFAPSRVLADKPVSVDGTEVIQTKLNFEIASCGFCFGGLAEFRRQVAWADVVHYHFPWPFADVMHLLVGVEKPSILTYHSDIVRQNGLLKLYEPLMNKFLDSVDRIICTSPNYLQISAALQVRKPKVGVIPIGISASSFPTPSASLLEQVKQAYGENFFLFVGMLRYYKGLDILLEACRGLEHPVVIAGEGPEAQALKKQAGDAGLTQVHFAGRVSEEMKMALYQRCLAVVFPSHQKSEAFGVTLLEGSMCGKPLITADTGTGTSFVNQHGVTGFVVAAKDPVAFGAAMQTFITDKALAREMGLSARARFEEKFTGSAMGTAYHHEYRQLLGIQD